MLKMIMPYVAKFLSSDGLLNAKRWFHESLRRRFNRPHTLDIFIRVDDPYSYLLVQVLDDFLRRFKVTPRFHTLLNLQSTMFPEQDMWYDYAVIDAYHLASLYDLDFPKAKRLTDQAKINAVATVLTGAEGDDSYLIKARELLSQLWFDKPLSIESCMPFTHNSLHLPLAKNERLLKKMGHYSGAMIHYADEWYWGVDRLDHLERRLICLKCEFKSDEAVQFDRTYRYFCREKRVPSNTPLLIKPMPIKPLVLYWSARSPYSYIALERAIQLADHYQCPLEIKPVLPMVMRGMAVPNAKKMYIFRDTKREAKKLGLNYGFVADPLGAAVKRCYALVDYAKAENKLPDFLLSFGRAVNTQGVRADTDSGMKKIVLNAGLDWKSAKRLFSRGEWEGWARNNLNEMLGMGCWGVPCFRYEELILWGQDRIFLIEQRILADMTVSEN